jgi:hypothetical protein
MSKPANAKAAVVAVAAEKPNGNGKLKLLKPDQQLSLSAIFRRIQGYQVEAGRQLEQATLARDAAKVAMDRANAANAEFQKAIEAYYKARGIDGAAVELDLDKMQVQPKSAQATA